MALSGFPPSTSDPNDPFFAIEQLGADPAQWETAELGPLQQLVVLESMRWARGGGDAIRDPLMRLYTVFTRRAEPEQRMQALQTVGQLGETIGRASRSPDGAAASVPFLTDPSPVIVATAALQLACLDATEEDPLSGARSVFAMALTADDAGRRAAALGGLLSLGDAAIAELLGNCWEHLDPDAFGIFARMACGAAPTPVVVDFFVRWVEAAVADGSEVGLGDIAAALLALARRAATEVPGFGQTGVVEIDRGLPVWTRPEDQVIKMVRRWSRDEYAELIAPRLVEVARGESHPRILPRVLREWGVPDVPHLEAVAGAVGRAGGAGPSLTLFDEPVAVDTPPDWDQENVILEWGVLNPNGPTMCQVSLVPVGADEGRAIVWTQHHFLQPECAAWAAGSSADAAGLRAVLAAVFKRNGSAEQPLIASLPHWVRVPRAVRSTPGPRRRSSAPRTPGGCARTVSRVRTPTSSARPCGVWPRSPSPSSSGRRPRRSPRPRRPSAAPARRPSPPRISAGWTSPRRPRTSSACGASTRARGPRPSGGGTPRTLLLDRRGHTG